MDRAAAFPAFPELATSRLRLRKITTADTDWHFGHFARPEIVSGQGYPAPADLAAALEELHRFIVDLFALRLGFRGGIAFILERAGFAREAFLPLHGENEHGQMVDDVLFGLERPGAQRPGTVPQRTS